MASAPPHAQGIDFVVDRNDLRRVECVAAPPPAELESGRVLLRVDAFAFTANNVTYAVAGDMLSYWSFFPARAGWGRRVGVGRRPGESQSLFQRRGRAGSGRDSFRAAGPRDAKRRREQRGSRAVAG